MVKILSQFVFVYFFSRSKNSCVNSLDFVDVPKRAMSDFVDNFVVKKKVFLFNFDKLVPFYFNRFKPFVKLIQTSVHIKEQRISIDGILLRLMFHLSFTVFIDIFCELLVIMLGFNWFFENMVVLYVENFFSVKFDRVNIFKLCTAHWLGILIRSGFLMLCIFGELKLDITHILEFGKQFMIYELKPFQK